MTLLDQEAEASKKIKEAQSALEKDVLDKYKVLGVDEVKRYNIGDVLRHVTVNERKVENLTREEFDRITCWAGSHYELKDEYKGGGDTEYQIAQRHDTNHKVGKKIIKKQDVEVFDASIDGLEQEIDAYRREKHGELGRHDRNLIRMYANIGYIAREDPDVQLPVTPPDQEHGK